MKKSQGDFIIGQLWFILSLMAVDRCGWLATLFAVSGLLAILNGYLLAHKERLLNDHR